LNLSSRERQVESSVIPLGGQLFSQLGVSQLFSQLLVNFGQLNFELLNTFRPWG
jgi:hypothetical protein